MYLSIMEISSSSTILFESRRYMYMYMYLLIPSRLIIVSESKRVNFSTAVTTT